MKLLENASNGTGTSHSTREDLNRFRTTVKTLYVYGTFDGATVKLQISPDNSNWFDVPDADTITVQSVMNIQSRGIAYRGVVSGGSGSESITMILY